MIKGFNKNEIMLNKGSILVDADWYGGSCVDLTVTLHIDGKDESYDCTSIESAFNKYLEITGEM